MITRKSQREIDNIKEAGKIVTLALNEVKKYIKPGVSTQKLDSVVYDVITKNGAIPSFLGLYDFPSSACISVNEEVVHGIPSKSCILKDGDIVTIDAGAKFNGMHADGAWTFPVGNISREASLLLTRTKESLDQCLKYIKPGNRVGDISASIEKYIRQFGYGMFEEICGHGIGSSVHEDPQILNIGKPNTGSLLKPGMTFCVEPMIAIGTHEMVTYDDDWTIASADHSLTAHFEYTILVTEDGYELITQPIV